MAEYEKWEGKYRMASIVISGKFLTQPINGIPRYASEIVRALDELVSTGYIEIIVPKGYANLLHLTNIKIVESKPLSFGWDVFVAERYASKKKCTYVNFTSKGCLYKKSIICLHDIRPLTWGDGGISIKTLKNKLKVFVNCWLAVKKSKIVVTVSEFEKKEIIDYFKLKNKQINVIGNGWEHLNYINNDDRILNKYSFTKRKQYYFSIGSVAPHKNFKWIIEMARNNLEDQFVIAGGINRKLWDKEDEISDLHNLKFIGYITDEEMKTLMINCKALLFPSLYEGFGIPPLEALSVGVPAIVSDIPVMHEIFGDSVYYINTNDKSIKLNALLQTQMESGKNILEKYTWKQSAEEWLKLFRTVN